MIRPLPLLLSHTASRLQFSPTAILGIGVWKIWNTRNGLNWFKSFVTSSFLRETKKVEDSHSLSSLHKKRLCLKGNCRCGDFSFEAFDAPTINFISHKQNHIIQLYEDADNNTSSCIHVSGFNVSKVVWMFKQNVCQPKTYQNKISCACEENEVLAIDERKELGLYLIDHTKVINRDFLLDPIYKPNQHFFVTKQILSKLNDNFPKWETIAGSKLISPIIPYSFEAEVGAGNTAKFQLKGTQSCENGSFYKDVLPIGPHNIPQALDYTYVTNEIPKSSNIPISKEKIKARMEAKYEKSSHSFVAPTKSEYDAIIVGGGHNGLVAAACLAKHGMKVLVLERRHVVGGAAVTEEIIPGFKFSRGSYLAGLLRPNVINELELSKYGFKYLQRNPSSFTPTLMSSIHQGKYLLLGEDNDRNWNSIAQFSKSDADAFPVYEDFLGKIREIIQPILDSEPPNFYSRSWKRKVNSLSTISKFIRLGYKNKEVLVPFYELFTGSAENLLNRWFESDILKTTLACDSVIGALTSPKHNGSAYVLLHHVMGEAAGKKGVWSYVEGGMGSVSNAIAASAKHYGCEIATNATVVEILYTQTNESMSRNLYSSNKSSTFKKTKVNGVKLEDGTIILSDIVVSGCTPYHTFIELLPSSSDPRSKEEPLPKDFVHHIKNVDFGCGAFKINLAVDRLPNFTCFPSPTGGSAGDMHKGTIHFESTMEEIDHAYREASVGLPASRPLIEMTIPSSLDNTIAPPGKHVVQLFVQYAPYDLDPKVGNWADPYFKYKFAERCINIVDEFAPNFSSSIIGWDVLSPLDLERIFGMHKGNIHHGSICLDQLGYSRPVNGYSDYTTPMAGLYHCSSGSHPGGGVMAAPGYNCARVILSEINF